MNITMLFPKNKDDIINKSQDHDNPQDHIESVTKKDELKSNKLISKH